MDKYGDRLLPPCVVDCLWHTVCVGFIICQTENGVSAQNGMEKLGVQCGGTLMTDEGEAWMQVVDHFKKKHTLCAKHFSNKICSAQAGLGGIRRDAFFRDASDLIYTNFHTPDHLETKFQIARELSSRSNCSRKPESPFWMALTLSHTSAWLNLPLAALWVALVTALAPRLIVSCYNVRGA